mmetsp:Transcript_14268/g.15814  ORF Transcript_14268/g.15814 Transcript_14268/m.15814 type:complete len:93 (+) Transcript_14268:1724-2002(+)
MASARVDDGVDLLNIPVPVIISLTPGMVDLSLKNLKNPMTKTKRWLFFADGFFLDDNAWYNVARATGFTVYQVIRLLLVKPLGVFLSPYILF